VTPAAGPHPDPATNAFRAVALVEAVTYLLLLGATLAYRAFDGPDLVGVLGPVHGIAFLVYLVLALKIRPVQGWTLGRLLLVLVLAAVPLGAVWVERRLVDPAPAPAGA